MNKILVGSGPLPLRKSLLSVAIATALFSAAAPSQAAPVSVKGTVAGSYFTPPVNSDNPALSTASSTAASLYAGAKVCFDLNNNGACDSNEPNTISKSDGSFTLTSATAANLIAEISTNATNGGNPVTQRNVFRVAAAQVAAAKVSAFAPATVAITPLSTEVLRITENDGLVYADAKGRGCRPSRCRSGGGPCRSQPDRRRHAEGRGAHGIPRFSPIASRSPPNWWIAAMRRRSRRPNRPR